MSDHNHSARRTGELLERLTMLRGLLSAAPINRLYDLLDARAAGDTADAVSCYHALTSALINCGARRVTGDIWKDFIFQQLIETPNRFSQLAAQGKTDPAASAAMEKDLAILQTAFALEDDALRSWVAGGRQSAEGPTLSAREDPAGDKISDMAISAWSGGSRRRSRPVPQPTPAPARANQAEAPSDWAVWTYDEPAEIEDYAADEGLAVLYRRFLASESWGELTDALHEFHAQYGSGEFLHHRVYTAGDDGLYPAGQLAIPDWDLLIDFDSQKERLYANTLRFLHTGSAEDALLWGADGMGKSSLVLSLVKELPELYLVFLTARSFDAMLSSVHILQSQPHRFILFLDDLELSGTECKRLKTMLSTPDSNILLYASSVELPLDLSVFTLQLRFDMPCYDDFLNMVHSMVEQERARISSAAVDEACENYRLNNDDFSVRAARRVAQTIIRAQVIGGEAY